jgi:predicted metal-binding protein
MSQPIRSARTHWTTVVLVCGKCARKTKGGYGPKGKDSLRDVLRAAAKARGEKRAVRVIETRCMGLCPKDAVTALNAGRPERIFAVPVGADAAALLALAMDDED